MALSVMCKMQQNKQDKHAIINNKSELYKRDERVNIKVIKEVSDGRHDSRSLGDAELKAMCRVPGSLWCSEL